MIYKRRSNFLNFIFACIPGAGYMYNGLLKRGLEVLLGFGFVMLLGDFLHLSILIPAILIPFWFYTFFDTFNVKTRLDHGEYIEDKFILLDNPSNFKISFNKLNLKVIGTAFLVIGFISIFNLIINDLVNYLNLNINLYRISYTIRSYFMPILCIVFGFYLLRKNKSNKDYKKLLLNPDNTENINEENRG